MTTLAWAPATVLVVACVACAAIALRASREHFAPLYAPSGVIPRARTCSRHAAAAMAAVHGTAFDRLVAAAKTQTAAYPSVLPN